MGKSHLQHLRITLASVLLTLITSQPAFAEVIYPAKLSVTDLKGGAFSSPTTVVKGKGDTEFSISPR